MRIRNRIHADIRSVLKKLKDNNDFLGAIKMILFSILFINCMINSDAAQNSVNQQKQKQAKVTKELKQLRLQMRQEKMTKVHLKRLKKAGVVKLLEEMLQLFR